jgi:hypothetical protein
LTCRRRGSAEGLARLSPLPLHRELSFLPATWKVNSRLFARLAHFSGLLWLLGRGGAGNQEGIYLLSRFQSGGHPSRLQSSASPGFGRIVRIPVFATAPLGPPRPDFMLLRLPSKRSNWDNADSSSCRRSVTFALIAVSTFPLRSRNRSTDIVVSAMGSSSKSHKSIDYYDSETNWKSHE